MRKAIIALVLALLPVLMAGPVMNDWTQGYEPCVSEDSPGPCYWDASERGNGEGWDFYVDGDQVITYIRPDGSKIIENGEK